MLRKQCFFEGKKKTEKKKKKTRKDSGDKLHVKYVQSFGKAQREVRCGALLALNLAFNIWAITNVFFYNTPC